MGSAIQFAVRDVAGGRQVGTVAGEGQGNFIQVGAGDSISLNISAANVVGYEQQGRDLIIKLADGRTIVLAGYFDPAGGAEHLYLSSDGIITEVMLANDGSGILTANFGPSQGWDKWSALDDLRFAEADTIVDATLIADEPAGMGLFAPALLGGMGATGAAGAGLLGLGLLGGGGSGGGGSSPAPVAVEITDGTAGSGSVENLEDYLDGVTITGRGTPSATIVVEIEGKTQTTTVEDDGSWVVTFPSDDVEPGEREADVTVTATDSTGTTVTVTDRVVLDTVPHPITIAAVTGDDVVTSVEQAGGFAITGTTSPGATITLDLGGARHTTTADSQGTWTVEFEQGVLTAGTYEANVTVSTIDDAGNRSSTSRSFAVDTEVNVAFDPGSIAGDNVVNATETAAGVLMSGSSDPGSEVVVTWGGATRIASVDPSGQWNVTFPSSAVPTDGSSIVTVRATDSVGNTATATRSLWVDTQTGVGLDSPQMGDDWISSGERLSGVAFTGTAEAGAALVVEFGGASRNVTAGSDGRWSASFSANEVAEGTYQGEITVTAVDTAGNTASTSRIVNIDTETSVAIDLGQVGGDNVISQAERAAGISLTGMAEAGATVEVTFAGASRSVQAGADGKWVAGFATAEIPQGTTQTTVTVRSTDAFGNSATATRNLAIDTEVTPLTRTSLGAGSDQVVNAAEAAAGITVTGTVEAGSSVMVQFGQGQSRAANVGADGTWSIAIPGGQMASGEALENMVITATDAYGNIRQISETVRIDRIVRDFGPENEPLATDGILNAAEAAQGLSVTGTAEPGASVTIAISGGGTHTVVADGTGAWSSSFASVELPTGEVTSSVTVTATDLAGNVASYSQTLVVDTIAPGAPDVLQFQRNTQGLTRIVTDEVSERYDFDRINADGTLGSIDAVRSVDEVFGTQNVSFGKFQSGSFVSTPVPDGSYLVVNSTDTAGNESSTLLVVNNTNAPDVDLGRSGLSNFDFSAIDLSFAPDAEMTITEAQIIALTGEDQTLIVKGGSDDRVTLEDATNTGEHLVIDGQGYTIYTLGSSGATAVLDDDITVI